MRRKKNFSDRTGVDLVAYTHPYLPITEQYRLIRTNILFSSVDKEIKTILITSPDPAEGKSTTSANLAIVLAQQGKNVLLVDADLRKASVHYSFNISNMNGLTNILTRMTTTSETISKTHIPNLEVLPSGPIPPNPSELLNSEAMEKVMKELKHRFDYIIFDTPPVLAVTDSQVLANKCDGVVMVVASGKTRKDRALQSKELLIKAKSQLLGVIVNGVESTKMEYYNQYK
ncbi:CpsD/CapB family tyrosine-protein kinase [Heyndrickxia oleronia]|uniref:non-specific protein-tyrosine kinase n=1 Tax=Heyndrickxia oleronia TaxID=38875 RepID=A0A8E2LCZ5_9BACI|nr:CpsD/CapB family tyrosine-protein kinase [Heyndrickxia oleronia]NYV64891.1 CpsD/CapB family tyrosine-protein kinase [Bacillus sp. Gen3]MBU5210427.1 CpsD/CapB family tyrosine-protein kinase [Heyndrickxia oleronia]MEC1374179.1 CpsD/CapB family tyrosine-protein kinase [Heyndrickxia oleronia]OOP63014.1 capsular biosynthesis protein [Heyndrickxia oleronia]QQZ07215.1 CpsD/CapB family tyrosine-protein kinase [Heyndrickxia oleronia]